jgi:membrane-bound lytic murein transglycosylase A
MTLRTATLVVALVACGLHDAPAKDARPVGVTAAPAPASAGETVEPPEAPEAPEATPCPDGAGGMPGVEGSATPRDPMTLTATTFAALPAWTEDHLAEAVPSFLNSCARLAELPDGAPVGVDGAGGKARQWRAACAAAAKLKPGDDDGARKMFEREFVPYVAAGKGGTRGKLTGYDVQEMHASKTRHDAYQIPVLARPSDLAMVDLGDFLRDAHARKLWGRLDPKGKLVAYPTRQEIRTGALGPRAVALVYADDPVDVLYAQIEGSAKAVLDDGTTMWLEFDGKNGRSYRGVGGVFKTLGLLGKGQRTMQGMRTWFKANPKRFDEIVDQDQSYVFFKVSAKPGAVGTQDVILTAERSMAVDRSQVALSTPIWVETRVPIVGKPGAEDWHHLLIAQDTGAGIMGAVRGDIYWGDDAKAAEFGGRMGGPGKYWLLLPRGVKPTR